MGVLKTAVQKDLVPVIERVRSIVRWMSESPRAMGLMVTGVTTIIGALGNLGIVAGAVFGGILSLATGLGTMWEVFTSVVSAGYNGLKSILDSIGQFVMVGLADGIKRGAIAVYDAVSEVGGRILSSLKSKLGIASPSRRGMELGNFFGQGVAIGIAGGADGIARASAGLGAAAEGGFSPRAQLGGGSSGGGSGVLVNIVNHYHIAEAPDPAQFAKDVGALMGSQVQTQVDRYMSRLVFQAGGA